MNRLIVIAPVSSSSGFGVDASERMKALVKDGYEFILRPWIKGSASPTWLRSRTNGAGLPDEPNELIIGPPGCCLPTPGKRTVSYVALESTELREFDFNMLSRAAAIICPSKWNYESLKAAGLKQPMRICAQGVDGEMFKPRPKQKREQFLFGCAGNTAGGSAGRKGLERVIEAFQIAFQRDSNVVLMIKDHPRSSLVCFDRRVEIVREVWTQDRLAEWYSSLDVFVSASHGEGWGRMVHEAMASGVPVITPKHGGVAEFFTSDCGWTLAWDEVQAENGWAGKWCNPRFQDIVDCMIDARGNPDFCKKRGETARARALEFTWEKVNPFFIETLISLGAIQRRQDNLTAASLRTIYTYCEKIGNHPMDLELLELSKESFRRNGFNVIVLNEHCAKQHPLCEKLECSANLYDHRIPDIYSRACYRRWLAVLDASKYDSLPPVMVDFDVINYGFTPADLPTATDTLTMFGDFPCPGMMIGTRVAFEKAIAAFSDYADSPVALKMGVVHDQNILDNRMDIWSWADLVKQYKDDGWDTARLVHYPHSRLPLWGHRGEKIKELRPIV